ncbi:MAG TPA: serine/threonine-protein kinase [Polyangiaceae bacterium]|nr:serine/threonine-protein kinase [Polyangiaceae bacterium]
MLPASASQLVARKYQLVRLVRSGGMGAVYEAMNVDTRGRCALKLLRPEVADNEDFKERFFREARACSVVTSDHIVKVFDSGTDEASGSPYLAMEYLEGEDVEATKARLGAMSPSACLKIVLQAALGLAKAHAAGIIHRDIKPANLFLTTNDADDLVVKILDFGIAKIQVDRFLEISTDITRSQVLLGTPLYMSPEQCKGAAKIDARSDVWSLGVVLWELLAGTSPFPQPRSLGALMASIITEDLPLIQDLAPWVNSSVAEVVHRAMSRDIDKRYANAGELRDALLSVTPGGPHLPAALLEPVSEREQHTLAARYEVVDKSLLSPARPELAATVVLSPEVQAPKKTRPLGAAIGLGAMAAIGVGWLLLRGQPEPVSAPPPRVVATSSLLPQPPPSVSHEVVPVVMASAPVAPASAAPQVRRNGSDALVVKSVRKPVIAAPSVTSSATAASSAPPPPIRTDTREFPE